MVGEAEDEGKDATVAGVEEEEEAHMDEAEEGDLDVGEAEHKARVVELMTLGVRKRRHEHNPADIVTDHCPVASATRRNCIVCWRERQVQAQSRYACAVCKYTNGYAIHLCTQPGHSCFQCYLSADFQNHY